MNDEIDYTNNPLHGVGLKTVVTELVGQYGFPILFAYLNINCFKTNPSIESSVQFLKKTDWAREKVEVFYLYEFKNLPRASSEQFQFPPRERVIPEDQVPGEPKQLSFQDAERLREKRAAKLAERDNRDVNRSRGGFGGQRNAYSKDRSSRPAAKPRRESSSSRSTSSTSSTSTGGKVDPWAKAKRKSE